MRNQRTVLALSALAATFALGACDVRKTQEGDVTVPKYEVEKTQEGNVTLPKYDVTTPDIKVGTTQTEVTVPKLTTEKETITVPVIGVKTADEKLAEERAAAAKK